MTTTAGHHHDPLRQARLELSELRAGIEGLADPHQREQLALTIRNLSAFRHAATFQATQDRAALDPEHGSWLATILRSWSPRQLAGLRPGTSGPPFWAASCAARRLQRWAVGARGRRW